MGSSASKTRNKPDVTTPPDKSQSPSTDAAKSVQLVGATKPSKPLAEKPSTPKAVTETLPVKSVIRKDASKATKKTSVNSVDSNQIQQTIDRVWQQIDTGARPPPIPPSIRGGAPQ